MSHEDGWLMVGDIPTRLRSWGSRPRDGRKNDLDTGTSDKIVLMLSGNPGVTGFYEQFLAEIHNQLAIPVWAICQAGHENPSMEAQLRDGVQMDKGIKSVYDVAEQVNHKAEFIRQFVPKDCKVILIGHSFGAKITVELLKMADLKSRISKCYLVFPTLEHIRETPNGKTLHPLFTVYLFNVIIFLSWIFTLFPSGVRMWLLKTYFMMKGLSSIDASILRATEALIQPLALRNVFQLARDEMLKIKDLDKEVISECKEKLKIYFGAADGWAPLAYQTRLKDVVPGIDSSTLDSRFKHDFVLDSSEQMAQIIADQIKKINT